MCISDCSTLSIALFLHSLFPSLPVSFRATAAVSTVLGVSSLKGCCLSPHLYLWSEKTCLRQQSWVTVSPLVPKDLYLIPLLDSPNSSLLTCLNALFTTSCLSVEICGSLSCRIWSSSPTRLPEFLKKTSLEGMGGAQGHKAKWCRKPSAGTLAGV